MNNKTLSFATYYRVAATLLILLCHFTAQSNQPLMKMSSQLFNIGVPMFFILSGFLFGSKGDVDHWGKWFLKRGKRIFIPYWIFLTLLLFIHLITKHFINFWRFAGTFLGLKQLLAPIQGGDHLWFITSLLLCYLLTPFIQFLLHKSDRIFVRYIVFSILLLFPLITAFCVPSVVHTLLYPISEYSLAYYLGRTYEDSKPTKGRMLLVSGIGIAALGFRLAMHFFIDGTITYDRVVCSYTHSIAAFCILCVFSGFFSGKRVVRPISFLSDISFELYTVHYMFCVGPIRLFGLSGIWIVDSVIVFALSCLLAYIIHSISDRVLKKEPERK